MTTTARTRRHTLSDATRQEKLMAETASSEKKNASENNVKVVVVDATGKVFRGSFDPFAVDRPCSVCTTLHQGMNVLAIVPDNSYCNDCYYKMGMRAVNERIYAHTAPDTLFINDMANSSACPTHVPEYGPATPYSVIQKVMKDPPLEQSINECLGEHGRCVTHEDLQAKATFILDQLLPEQFECLVKQGKL